MRRTNRTGPASTGEVEDGGRGGGGGVGAGGAGGWGGGLDHEIRNSVHHQRRPGKHNGDYADIAGNPPPTRDRILPE